MKYYQKLMGQRIYLSPINVEDTPKYSEWINDMAVSVRIGRPWLSVSHEQEKEALEGMIKEGNHFAIILQNEDKLIGNCSLFMIDQLHSKAELGIMIGDKEYWSNGYGTETIMLLLNYGFNILNLHNVLLRVFSFNERAIKCYIKCGFKEFGRRRESYVLGKEKYDEVYMDILSSEFDGDIKELFPEGL